jgi:hypothetical protein
LFELEEAFMGSDCTKDVAQCNVYASPPDPLSPLSPLSAEISRAYRYFLDKNASEIEGERG